METTQMDSDAYGLYMKPELEAGDTTKRANIAEDRIAELDAEAEATHEEGNKAQTARDNRESTVTTMVSSEIRAP
jgi:hypothetical protein